MQRQQPASNTQNIFPWCNPQHFTANQQGNITAEQRLMLKSRGEADFLPAGCFGSITFLTIIPSFLLAGYLHNQLLSFLFLIPLSLAVVAFVSPYMKRANLLYAAESGKVAVEQGEVIWQKNNY